MGQNLSLYGLIGYTYLRHDKKNPKYILILSDNHSKLPYCEKYKMISEWLYEKIKYNNILLEEVPRNNVILKELFQNSDHTQELKKIYLDNPELIKGVDIRPLLIKFSWDLLNQYDFPESNILFSLYLEDIDNFFNFNNIKIIEIDKYYNKENIKKSESYIQFKILKKMYNKYKNKNKIFLNKSLKEIFNKNKNLLEVLDSFLDNIMEFYIIFNIFKFKNDNKNIIVHTGLFHSEKIVFWLENIYYYNIIETKGINYLDELEKTKIKSGCLNLSNNINDQLSNFNNN